MPPVPCTTAVPFNTTLSAEDALALAKDDRNALLYIVVTLLFYSMGIIVGIITYLKRERREMLEDKTFDVYFQMKSDPYTTFKAERVQMVAARLAELEKKRLEEKSPQLDEHQCNKTIQNQSSMEVNKYDSSDCEISPTVTSPSKSSSSITSSSVASQKIPFDSSMSTPAGENISEMDVDSMQSMTHGRSKPTAIDANLKQLSQMSVEIQNDDQHKTHNTSINQRSSNPIESLPSTSGEPAMASGVTKLFESERRGGLRISPKALHLFDRNKRKLQDRQLSLDVTETRRRVIPKLQNRQLSMDIPDRDIMTSNLCREMEQVRPLLEEDVKSDNEMEKTGQGEDIVVVSNV